MTKKSLDNVVLRLSCFQDKEENPKEEEEEDYNEASSSLRYNNLDLNNKPFLDLNNKPFLDLNKPYFSHDEYEEPIRSDLRLSLSLLPVFPPSPPNPNSLSSNKAKISSGDDSFDEVEIRGDYEEATSSSPTRVVKCDLNKSPSDFEDEEYSQNPNCLIPLVGDHNSFPYDTPNPSCESCSSSNMMDNKRVTCSEVAESSRTPTPGTKWFTL
ncbi:unnamed protein product [Cochlearia groenlandica]